jgi:hypothetical protein
LPTTSGVVDFTNRKVSTMVISFDKKMDVIWYFHDGLQIVLCKKSSQHF